MDFKSNMQKNLFSHDVTHMGGHEVVQSVLGKVRFCFKMEKHYSLIYVTFDWSKYLEHDRFATMF